jgi:enoyl-CoA hydratase/carnithine racemase
MLELNVEPGVARITIPSVQALSRHDVQAGQDLRAALWEATDEMDVKAIILRTEGDDFCAPLSAEQVTSARENFTSILNTFHGQRGLYQTMRYAKRILITEVQGTCTAAGTLLVLCSNLVVASPDATFKAPFKDAPGGSVVLSSITMGMNRTKAWGLTGRAFSASEALSYGLVNWVEPREQLGAKSLEIARKVARMPLDALTTSLVGFNGVLDLNGVGQDFETGAFSAVTRAALAR